MNNRFCKNRVCKILIIVTLIVAILIPSTLSFASERISKPTRVTTLGNFISKYNAFTKEIDFDSNLEVPAIESGSVNDSAVVYVSDYAAIIFSLTKGTSNAKEALIVCANDGTTETSTAIVYTFVSFLIGCGVVDTLADAIQIMTELGMTDADGFDNGATNAVVVSDFQIGYVVNADYGIMLTVAIDE